MNFEFNESSLNLYDQNKLIANIEFTMINNGKTYAVEHTWVDDEYRGQGIAGKITIELLNTAKQQGKDILPICPYTKAFFKHNKKYADLLAPNA